MSHIRAVTFAAACGLLAACQGEAPVNTGAVISPRLDSGISANNGGGQRATGDLPSVSIGPQGAVLTGAPSGPGAAY